MSNSTTPSTGAPVETTFTEFDAWATDPAELAGHRTSILDRLNGSRPGLSHRWAYVINPTTGHLNGHDLCWICATGLAHRARHLPSFRACHWCLSEDKRQARKLGLLHLLPVFEYPFPPVRDAHRVSRLDAAARRAIAQAWSQVSVLDRWRQDAVHLAYSWLGITDREDIDLFDWQRRLTVGESRSRSCWQAYVEGYQPELARALRESTTQEVGK